jgi:type I restriction enzyme, S subunit
MSNDPRVRRLCDLISLEYGRALPTERRTGNSYPVYGSSGQVGLHNRPISSSRGIIVGRKGTVGSIIWSTRPFWPIDTTYFVRWLNDELDHRWTYWVLKHLPLHRLDSSTGVPGLNRNDIYKIRIAVPHMSEQRRIAEILDTTDGLIRSVERLISKHQTVRDAVISSLLNSAQTVPAERLIADIEAGWSPECLEIAPPAGTWGVLKVSSITSGVFDPSQAKTFPMNSSPRPEITVRPGDVLLCRANGVAELVGTTVYVNGAPDRLMLSDKTLRIKPRANRVTAKYLTLALRGPHARRQILKFVSGSSGQSNLSQNQILRLLLPWAPLEGQNRATSTIGIIDNEISHLSDEHAKLWKIKHGLVEDLLTGRVRVTAE